MWNVTLIIYNVKTPSVFLHCQDRPNITVTVSVLSSVASLSILGQIQSFLKTIFFMAIIMLKMFLSFVMYFQNFNLFRNVSPNSMQNSVCSLDLQTALSFMTKIMCPSAIT